MKKTRKSRRIKQTKMNVLSVILGRLVIYLGCYALSVVGIVKLGLIILENCITTI